MHKQDIELTVIAPMYNEEENIEHTIQAINSVMEGFPHMWELLLVNDGSVDGTLEMARDWEEKIDHLRVVSYPDNQGRGKALRTGFQNAWGKYVVSIDFDLSYAPEHILRLYNELVNQPMVDIVLGSAYMDGGQVVGGDSKRLHLFLSRMGNRILEMAFAGRYKTITCVLRGYRREVLEALVLESDRKEIHLEILSKATALGFKIKEIPATLTVRQRGTSKTKLGKTSFSHLVFSIYERPILWLSITGAALGAIGILIGIYLTGLWLFGDLNPGRPLFFIMVLMILTGGQFISFGLIAGQNSFLRNEIYKLQSQVKLMNNRIKKK